MSAEVEVALVLPTPPELADRGTEPRLTKRVRAKVGALKILALGKGGADERDRPSPQVLRRRAAHVERHTGHRTACLSWWTALMARRFCELVCLFAV